MDLPPELQAVFRRHHDAKAKFEGYGPKHQQEDIQYVAEAKKPETRLKRADRVVMMLTGKKLATVFSGLKLVIPVALRGAGRPHNSGTAKRP